VQFTVAGHQATPVTGLGNHLTQNYRRHVQGGVFSRPSGSFQHPLHDQCRIEYGILCRQIYAISDSRSQYLGEQPRALRETGDGLAFQM